MTYRPELRKRIDPRPLQLPETWEQRDARQAASPVRVAVPHVWAHLNTTRPACTRCGVAFADRTGPGCPGREVLSNT